LCGLEAEAAIIQSNAHRVLCGAAQRDDLAKLVGAEIDGLVSFGVAGALAPDLAVGDLVVASGVTLPDGTYHSSDFAWMKSIVVAIGARPCAFFSAATEQAATREQRAALRAALMVHAADQETFAVAGLAAARRLPWIAVRAVSDLATDDLPSWSDRATRPDGSPDLAVIARALADPAQGAAVVDEAVKFDRALAALRGAWDRLKPEFLLS
jgi:adenosylhomocysteine nucleosidase